MAIDKLNIAIIGAGIAGLSAGYILSKHHRVVVYEQNNYMGGNARSIDIKIQDENICIDTGFVSFSEKNYPNFINFIKHMNVSTKSHKPSFSSSFEQEKFEFHTNDIYSLFKKTDVLLEREMHAMKKDLDRFASLIAKYKQKSNTTIEEFLDSVKLGKYFTKYYFLPLVSLVSEEQNVQFLKIHHILRDLESIGVLGLNNLMYSIDGGIVEFIKALKQNIKILE